MLLIIVISAVLLVAAWAWLIYEFNHTIEMSCEEELHLDNRLNSELRASFKERYHQAS